MIWPARDSQRRPLTDTAEHFNLPVDNKAISRLSNNQTSTITLSDETWQSWFVSFGKFFHFKAANQKKNENHNFRIQFHFFHEFKTDFLFFLFSILSEKRENEKKSNYEHLTKKWYRKKNEQSCRLNLHSNSDGVLTMMRQAMSRGRLFNEQSSLKANP